MQLTQDYTQDIAGRFRWIHVLLFLFAAGMLTRLYYLQVVHGEEYRRFSQEYSIREAPVPAPRGLILDRNGRVLSSNQPSLDLVVIPQYVMDWEGVRASLSQLLDISPKVLDAAWARRIGKASYQAIVVMTNMSLDVVSRIKAQKTPWYFPEDPFDLRGVEIYPRADRRYSDGSIATHVLGYLKESEHGTWQGAGGVEAQYDNVLQGIPGSRERVVDARGREIDYPSIESRLVNHDPIPGGTIQLGLDVRLQEAARKAFAGRTGALVALDPMTGAVLALYSSPSYDLSRFSQADRGSYFQELLRDKEIPLYNRAVQGAYPPGSTYKMVTAIAGLSEGVVTPDEKITCRGGLVVGGRRFSCWNKGGHGSVAMVQAITQSCDVYFYTVGMRLGLDRLAKYAHMLGLGAKTQIDLPHERAGSIPTNAWKQKRFGRSETSADQLMSAIGQGYDTLTPLQLALMVSRLVNGGKAVVPHVVTTVVSPRNAPDGGAASSGSPLELALVQAGEEMTGDNLSLDPTLVEYIRKGMEGVVNGPGGTARSLAALKLKVAGKTGTAQTVSNDSKIKSGDHAWFVGYAPYDDPKIVVAAVLEYAGHGGAVTAPLVGAVIRAYLSDSVPVEKVKVKVKKKKKRRPPDVAQ